MAVTKRLERGGYDLHTHTTASDGLMAPRDSVALAASLGLAGLAITDHDTVAGVAEAVETGAALGVDVIPGVEISTKFEDEDVHMLGLWIDPADPTLIARLESNRDVRRGRNAKIVDKLCSFGFDVTLAEAEAIAAERRGGGDRSVSRPHLAELLVRKGYVSSVQEAFDVYLDANGKAYVSVDRIPPETAAAWIRDAGGVAVLAHPGLYRRDDAIVAALADAVDGIEAAHADHDERLERKYRALAERYGLAATAGSDFHGVRDGAAYHAMLGSRTVDRETIARLETIRRRKRETI